MSTPAVIARPEGPADFAGRYRHHRDGHPSGVGRTIWQLYHGRWNGEVTGDWQALQALLIDAHPSGWQTIVADWGILPKLALHNGPRCYCHSANPQPARLLSEATALTALCQFAYLLDWKGAHEPVLRIWVLVPRDAEEAHLPAHLEVARLALHEAEPNWAQLDAAVGY